jgi:hypothetical protein
MGVVVLRGLTGTELVYGHGHLRPLLPPHLNSQGAYHFLRLAEGR